MPWLAVVLSACLGSVGLPATTAAQEAPDEADVERARELFAEALALADGGDWERAVHRFRSAIELRDAPTIRYNLASSLAQLNELREALEELDHVDTSEETTPDLRAQAAALRAEIAPRLGRLRVDVSGPGAEGTHVTVDGEAWDAVGRYAPSDPGVIHVRLWRGDDPLDHEEVDVADGGQATVSLAVPAVDLSPAAVAEAAAEPGDSDEALWIGLGIGAGVVVVAAAVVVVVVLASSGAQTSEGDFDPGILRVR